MRREILVFPDPFLARRRPRGGGERPDPASSATCSDDVRRRRVGLAATQVGWGSGSSSSTSPPWTRRSLPLPWSTPRSSRETDRSRASRRCLSVPGSRERCAAPKRSRCAAWTSRGIRFGSRRPDLSRALQHEIDHLDGVLSSIAFPPPLRPSRSDPPVARSRRRPVAHGFMGTPGFAVPSLAALAEAVEVTLVLCNPDRPRGADDRWRRLRSRRRRYAAGSRLPAGKGAPPRRRRADRRRGADLIVVVAYGHILPKSILDIPVRLHQRHASSSRNIAARSDQLGGGPRRNGDGDHDHEDG